MWIAMCLSSFTELSSELLLHLILSGSFFRRPDMASKPLFSGEAFATDRTNSQSHFAMKQDHVIFNGGCNGEDSTLPHSGQVDSLF